ncbi:MAG TPA: hypothetical protein VK864_12610 [Longimicrobiales bacterium]|nr:hypothetical protein [Longimicrobiales bacterium]
MRRRRPHQADVAQLDESCGSGAARVRRALRYTLLAWLGSVYGAHIFRFFSRYDKLVVIALISLAVIAGVVVLALTLRRRKTRRKRPQAKAA